MKGGSVSGYSRNAPFMNKDFFQRLRDRIPTSYYYVPPCPVCGSRMTGRFIKQHNDVDTQFAIKESLRHGELVSPVSEIPEKNLFCVECGHTWSGPVPMRFISHAEMMEEREARNTDAILQQELDEEKEDDKSRSRGLFSSYVGKL